MKGLAENSISEEVLKSLWLQRLRQQLQAILSISTASLDKIAEMADRIINIYSSIQICSVNRSSEPNNTKDERIKSLETSIAEFTQKFARGKPQKKSGNLRNRGRSRSNSSHYKLCWYHHKFGKNAHNCNKPCEFNTSENTSRKLTGRSIEEANDYSQINLAENIIL
ncbi:hypothetical protein HNY73_014195 [Argiope bruennichi]|uniref:Uncharacterized protein n=1 Tax=Argiope bruennichi TaxID=94029 RepID=A0A8T0EPM0_ARGBR|nr:hypothetical protein HNY73_014195 [Argiope bruennichi]